MKVFLAFQGQEPVEAFTSAEDAISATEQGVTLQVREVESLCTVYRAYAQTDRDLIQIWMNKPVNWNPCTQRAPDPHFESFRWFELPMGRAYPGNNADYEWKEAIGYGLTAAEAVANARALLGAAS